MNKHPSSGGGVIDPPAPDPGGTVVPNAAFTEFAVAPPVAPTRSTNNSRYVAPTARGSGSGTSWDNAASIMAINAMGAAATGGIVYIASDLGNYSISPYVSINCQDVSFEGVKSSDMTPAKVVFYGTRRKSDGTPWVRPIDPLEITDVRQFATGNESFRLNNGASRVRFKNFRFEHVAVCFAFKDAVSDITIENMEFYDVRRFSDTEANCSRVSIDGLTGIGHSKPAIRIQNNCNNFKINNYSLDSARQDGDSFAVGIGLYGTANNIEISNGLCSNQTEIINNYTVADPNGSTAYWNADGYSTEAGNYNVKFTNAGAYGVTDGGFDCKGSNHAYIDCYAELCKRSLRLWVNTHYLLRFVSRDPHKLIVNGAVGGTGVEAHVMGLDTADITMIDCQFIGGDPGNDVNGFALCVNYLFENPSNVFGFFRRSNVDISQSTAGQNDRIPAGNTIYNYVPDAIAPVFTGVRDFNLAEESNGTSGTLTATDAHNITFKPLPGLDRSRFTLDKLGNWTFSGLIDYNYPASADGTNSYKLNFIVVDEANNGRQGVLTINVTQLAGKNIPNRYIAPTAAGKGNGDGFANAASLANLTYMAGSAAAVGGKVIFATHLGDYTPASSPVAIKKGGTDTVPLVITGQNASGVSGRPKFLTNRFDHVFPTDPEQIIDVRVQPPTPGGENYLILAPGFDVFVLAAGADYITFENFDFERVQNCFNLQGNKGITINGMASRNIRRFITTSSNTTNPLPVNLLRVNYCTVYGHSKQAFQLQGNTYDVLVTNCDVDSRRMDGDSFAVCYQLNGVAHDIEFVDCSARNCCEVVNNLSDAIISGAANILTYGFYNGDGFSSEVGNYNVKYTRCRSYGHTDGGFDNKGNPNFPAGNPVTYIDCYAEDCGEGFRIWFDRHLLNNCTTKNMRRRGGTGPECHIGMSGGGGTFTINNHTYIQEPLNFPAVPYTPQQPPLLPTFSLPDTSKNIFRFQGTDTTLNVNGYTFQIIEDTALRIDDLPGMINNVINYNPALPAAAFNLNWRSGFTNGVAAASSVNAGTVIADFVGTAGGPGKFYEIANSDDGQAFSVVGTTLATSRKIVNGEVLNIGVRMRRSDFLNSTNLSPIPFSVVPTVGKNGVRNPAGQVTASADNFITIPKNWIAAYPTGMQTSYTRGVEGTEPYLDIRLSGTSTADKFMSIQPEAGTIIPATTADTFTASLDAKITLNSGTPPSFTIASREFNSSGTGITPVNAVQTTLTLDGVRRTYTNTRQPTASGTAYVAPLISPTAIVPAGSVFDITFRIYGVYETKLQPTLIDVTPTSYTFVSGGAQGTNAGNITGLTSGSTVSFIPANGADAGKVTVVDNRGSGGAVFLAIGGTAAAVGSIPGKIREALAEATNSPHDTAVNVAVTATAVIKIPSYIGKGTPAFTTAASPTTLNPGLPASLVADDVLLLIVDFGSTSGTNTATVPSGWTQLDASNPAYWWLRVAGGEVAPTIQITTTLATNGYVAGAQIYSIRDSIKTGNPFEGYNGSRTQASATANNPFTGRTVTTAGANRLVIQNYIGFNDYNDFAITTAGANNGWVLRSNEITTVGSDMSIFLDSKDAATAGAQSPDIRQASVQVFGLSSAFAVKPIGG